MIFICDFCNVPKKEVLKIPNAFIVEEGFILFPVDPKEKYTSICTECIGLEGGNIARDM